VSRVLVVYYSQTRQSQRVAQLLLGRYRDGEASLFPIKAKQDFSFPWKINSFFAQMPLCIENMGCAIEDFDAQALIDCEEIILVHPVWFLSPSLPVQEFFKIAKARGLIVGKKVVQILTCRNMWFLAAKKTKDAVENCGAEYCGHIALCDPNPNWATLVTTPRWMFFGKKNAFGIFPAAGISEKVYEDFGQRALIEVKALFEGNGKALERLDARQESRADAVSVCMEVFGHSFIFKPWAKLINFMPAQLKTILIFAFRINLVLMLLILVPFYELFSRVIPSRFLSAAKKHKLILQSESR
jgi:hypothetical protein